jgi:hypothetical protein
MDSSTNSKGKPFTKIGFPYILVVIPGEPILVRVKVASSHLKYPLG